MLTVKRVAKALRRGEPGRFFDAQGLYLVVEHKKNASWARRYELNKKAHEIGLGSAFVFDLPKARERNRAISMMLADGIDPLVQKHAQRAALVTQAATSKTFKECAEAYIADHQGGWRNAKHGAQWKTTLAQYVYPKIGGVDVAAIARPHILEILEQRVPAFQGNDAGKFWEARTRTADRVRSRIELVLSWATIRGHRSNGENPAKWEDVLEHVLPAPSQIAKHVHHPAVPYAEVPALVAAMRERQGVAAMALRFVVLTVVRTGEALKATWAEIDFDKKLWTIPADHMKSGREHIVPLSPAVIELLKSLPHEADNPHVFIGARQPVLSLSSLTAVMHRLGRKETNHGFRSSFSDWAHDQTAHSNHTIELSLAHSIGNATEQAYRRSDMLAKRRQLMEAWSKYCMSGASVARGHKVVAIGTGR